MKEQMDTLLEVLMQSEKKTQEAHQEKQKYLLNQLVAHACHTVPFYRDYSPNQAFATYPVLTRAAVQLAGDSLVSQDSPGTHGETYGLETSGSTGQGVRVLGTQVTRLFYDALMLREHLWYARDMRQKLMSIRWLRAGKGVPPKGDYQSTWGPPVDYYRSTGPGVLVNISSETRLQVEALIHHQPYYLATYPSQLAALAEACLEQGITLPNLHEVRTTGETLTQHHKALVHAIWPHVTLSDIYSCVELGNLAQQCPEYKQYHVNLEHVHLEIVDEEGEPCDIGQVGRVLITSLLNYATPLIRYELGDYAAFGEPCACGRTLPVLQSILGRKRNRLTLPSGESRFPYLGEREDLQEVAFLQIQKFQFIQHSLHRIEIKVVTPNTLTPEQEAYVKTLYQKNFGYAFEIDITYHDEILPGPSGKFEEFMSLV